MLCTRRTIDEPSFPGTGEFFVSFASGTFEIDSMSTSTTSAVAEVDLRYPIGPFKRPGTVSPEKLTGCISDLERLPDELQSALAGLQTYQLDTSYRPGGWTVRQVVHHLADSHINCYQRFRLALTEEAPLIKVYDEKAWAELSDAKSGPVDVSLLLLRALHARWTALLHELTPAHWARTFVHPEHGAMRLDQAAGMYAWHSRHHLAHIRGLREREGWE
jgi:hypothetical protein